MTDDHHDFQPRNPADRHKDSKPETTDLSAVPRRTSPTTANDGSPPTNLQVKLAPHFIHDEPDYLADPALVDLLIEHCADLNREVVDLIDRGRPPTPTRRRTATT